MGKGGNPKEQRDSTAGDSAENKRSNLKRITLNQLSEHRTPGNAWMAYMGTVYDVSDFGEKHPGGSVIFSHAGDDCTDVFNSFHPKWILNKDKIEELVRPVAVLDDVTPPTGSLFKNKRPLEDQKKFEAAYRKLRSELMRDGMFKSNPLYYLFKVVSTFSILVLSVLCFWRDGFAWELTGAFFLGLFWQQSGWLAHDFLHHQVFDNRVYGDLMGILIGNVWQGFSVQWWKSKHNTHHAVPNLTASSAGAADGDPDIDTMPILAWSQSMAELARDSKFGRLMVSWQAFTYFPILFFARMAWAQQSLGFIFGGLGVQSVKLMHIDQNHTKYKRLEMLGLISHYIGFLWICSFKPVLNGIFYFVAGQCLCGLMLALVFGLGHNGMKVYKANERPDFWVCQVSTTRNVTSNLFTDWFCGGLQYQVDHHLFPSIPRHNLHKVNLRVKQFCLDQGLSYHEANMWEGTKEVLKHLSEVSHEFIKEFPAM